ncbi:MAG: SEC-C domain-containing protein [Chlamydiales bacterium]|nr:SEC-C domain-containing protein [Chlamydiales bacterium]
MPPCPCHSGKPYADCCQSFHLGFPPPTALALMRSRYSAYALGLVDYIIHTTHSAKKPDRKEIEAFCNVTRFADLEILDVDEKEDEASIKFKATLLQGKHDVSFVEKSAFIKENNHWFYVSGCIN